ncbi:MAG: glycine cleavage system protein GcvH [Candidatus Binatus sp.]|uniref:glycine cleavage system protein GcvH n=2 Tax=Candidatus Binatus sp. TaxID=2811406 RepID=UPI003BD74C3E
MSPPRLARMADGRARIDDTAGDERQAIAARATANAIDARQSRVRCVIHASSGASRNLTKLAPLRFMTLDVIAIDLRARRGLKYAPLAIYGGIMEIPQGLKYSKEHEWVATEDTVATVGITDHAQDQLGEIVYIELPAVGDKVSKDDPFGVVESVKAVSDIYAPVTGTVIEINEDLPESPETVNEDPYGDGWLIKVKITDMSDLEDLMDADEYTELLAREKE